VRIIFLGTPEFSVASLDAIIKAGHEVAAVVTMPDKPAGRGMHLQQSAVKQYAMAHGLKVLQPAKLKDEALIQELKALHADIQVVIAFRMLPEAVWNMPKLGTVNLHASLLPDYRGAAPINWAIINGETRSGVCTFFLKHEIDTGNIILKREVAIGEDTTAGELHDVLKHTGAEVMVETLALIESGSYTTEAQPAIAGKPAPKIFKEHCRISWNRNCHDIYNLIRGLSPYPGAFTLLNGKVFKIYKATKEITAHKDPEGMPRTDGKTWLKFACADGYVAAHEAQLEGKKRMGIEEFLRGNKV
jgi:methionyl-tRNA formyltransferase